MSRRCLSPALASALTLVFAAALLAGCGGGGSGDDTPAPTVSSVTAATPSYGRPLAFTVTGTNLNNGAAIALSSPGCSGAALDGTASNSATQATFTCTPNTLGTLTATVVRAGNTGFALGTVDYTVPRPEVTMTVSNAGGGGSVNGSFVIELWPDLTPVTVDNFLAYVRSGFYVGTVIHRISPGVLFQGGGYTQVTPPATIVAKPGLSPAIALEVNRGLSNTAWTMAMARGVGPNTAQSQFFVNLQDNSSFYDPDPGRVSAPEGYAVFGTVTPNATLATAIAAASVSGISGFAEFIPLPNMAITAATQTR